MADERYITEDPELDDGQTADEDGEGAGLYEHFAVVADKGQAPLRLDKFLTVRMEKCSRNRIQAAADSGSILVNGKAAKSSYKVKPLDRIQIVMPYPRREVEIIPENIPLEIPYEDDDLLIVNKPAGLVVHPGHGNYSGTLVNALTYHARGTGPPHRQEHLRAARGRQKRTVARAACQTVLRPHHRAALRGAGMGQFRRGRRDHHGQHRAQPPRPAENVRLRGRLGRQARRDPLAGAEALRLRDAGTRCSTTNATAATASSRERPSRNTSSSSKTASQ